MYFIGEGWGGNIWKEGEKGKMTSFGLECKNKKYLTIWINRENKKQVIKGIITTQPKFREPSANERVWQAVTGVPALWAASQALTVTRLSLPDSNRY